jgi:hypothetical protein
MLAHRDSVDLELLGYFVNSHSFRIGQNQL